MGRNKGYYNKENESARQQKQQIKKIMPNHA